MISEGSCDTEDWSNDAANSAMTVILYNIMYTKVLPQWKICNIFPIYVYMLYIYIYIYIYIYTIIIIITILFYFFHRGKSY